MPYKNRYTLYHNALSSWPEVTGVGSILQTGNYNYSSQPTLYGGFPNVMTTENLNPTAVFKPSTLYPTFPMSADQYSRGSFGDSHELQLRKANSRCGKCDAFGHWYRDNVCKPEDIARKMAKIKAQDPQYHAAAEASALRLTQFPSQGN